MKPEPFQEFVLHLWENRCICSKNLNRCIWWVNASKRPCSFFRFEFQPKVADRSFRNYPLPSKYPFDSLPFQKIHCCFLPFKGTLSFLTWNILYIENIISEFLVRSHMPRMWNFPFYSPFTGRKFRSNILRYNNPFHKTSNGQVVQDSMRAVNILFLLKTYLCLYFPTLKTGR